MAGRDDEDFLSRWSRRKRAARAGAPVEEARPGDRPLPAPGADAAAPADAGQPAKPLPPVEELTPESDFSPFMEDEVDPGLRRQALRKLFSDPRFNVMDGMDVYVDDYSIPDPLPEEWLGKLAAMASLGDVPGRQQAEREARESDRREGLDEAGESARQGTEGVPEATGDPDEAPGADEGQVGSVAEPSGCDTPSIPASKVGD